MKSHGENFNAGSWVTEVSLKRSCTTQLRLYSILKRGSYDDSKKILFEKQKQKHKHREKTMDNKKEKKIK